MSNICLKVSVEKKWQTQNFSIMDLKSLSPGQFLRAKLTQISFNLNFFCCNLKIRGLGTKLYVAFLLYQFWKGLWRFKDRAMNLAE